MGRPAKAEARDTRTLILDAALDLFAERGYFGTSMREIAAGVGVRESALYHHFASKEEILKALIGEMGPARARRFEAVFSELARSAPPEKLLRAIAEKVLDDWTAPREAKFMRLMLADGARINQLTDFYPLTQVQNARAMLERLFQHLIDRKAIRKGNAAAMAVSFIGPLMMLRIIHYVMPASGKPDLKKLKVEVEHFIHEFLIGLKP